MENKMTVTERNDFPFGIISATECLHDHIKTAHGLISENTLSRLLDPSTPYLLTDMLFDPAVTFQNAISSAGSTASTVVLPLPHCSIIPDIQICAGLRPCCMKQEIAFISLYKVFNRIP
jgi:hypothetical protein